MKVYQVGGSVRDTLLGLPVQDRDWVVVGARAEDLVRQGYLPVGRDFPVFLHPHTREEYALARTERPGLILMDIVMPGTSGFQTARELARDPDTAAIPVVMCSTKAQESDRVWALRQGARDYLVKPVDPQALLACVAHLTA